MAEVTAVRKDGSHLLVRWHSTHFTAASGETLISVAFTDITAQKRIEDNARLLDYNLQLVLDNTDEPLALIDDQFRLITFNKAAETAFQLLHEGHLKNGDNVLEIIAASERSPIQSLFEAVLRGEPQEVLRKHSLPDGSILVYRTRLRPLFKGASAIGIILNAKDVTRKFLAEEALRKSNERFQRAAEASYDIIWEHDMDSDCITFTENFARLLGYSGCTELSSDEFLQQVVHPDDATHVASKAIAFLESTETHLFYPVHRLRKKDGSVIYVEAHAIASRDEQGRAYRLTGVTRDITAQHLMETRLTESNRRYELAAGASIDLVYEVDIASGRVIYNDVINSFYGYGQGELDNVHTTIALVHPDDQPMLRQALAEAEAERKNLLQIPTLRLLKKDGSVVVAELTSLIIRNERGQPVKRIGSVRDISWRYAMEQELRKSKERFELAAGVSYDLIWERDFATQAFYYNDTITSFYGYSAHELMDPDAVFARFPHPDDRAWLSELVVAFLQGTDNYLSYPVHRLLKGDGSIVWVEANAQLIRNETGALCLRGLPRSAGAVADGKQLHGASEKTL